MTIVEGAVHTLRTLVDGTLAIVVHIEPRNRKAALDLFADPGTPVALAALDALPEPDESDDQAPQADPKPEPAPKPVLGPLALWCVQRCREQAFQEWIRPLYDIEMGGSGAGWGDLNAMEVQAMGAQGFARHAVLVICDVQTRRELDHPEVARVFHERIRRPYADAVLEEA